MSTPVTYVANSYNIPGYQDTGYAQGTGNLSSYLIALATGSLTLSGGNLSLTADANFGASFGLISIYFKSRSSNIATAGVLRLANTDLIEWRDNANANNLILAMNATQTGGGTYTIPDIGAGTSASFVMTAGTQSTIAGAKTFTTQLIGKGTATNDSASAGYIGEIINANVVRSVPVSTVASTAKTVTSISLTAGDWDVRGAIGWRTVATTTTFSAAINTSTNALPTGDTFANFAGGLGVIEVDHVSITSGNDYCVPIPSSRVSVSTTTVIYLVQQSDQANNVYGYIEGRRIR